MDQSLGQHIYQIYEASIFSYGDAQRHSIPFDSDGDLIAKHSVVTTTDDETQGIFEKICQLLTSRYQACIDVGGDTFEQLQ